MASFQELKVWQRGIELVTEVYKLSDQLPASEKFALKSQTQRSSVSIPSNIAEGYRRNNRKEFKHFCGIALGSSAELETQLIIVQKIYPLVDCQICLDFYIEIQKMLTVLIRKI